jgi:hypothetical protein
MITSVMLVVDRPGEDLYRRVEYYFGKKRTMKHNSEQYFDMDIILSEFACNDDVSS